MPIRTRSAFLEGLSMEALLPIIVQVITGIIGGQAVGAALKTAAMGQLGCRFWTRARAFRSSGLEVKVQSSLGERST